MRGGWRGTSRTSRAFSLGYVGDHSNETTRRAVHWVFIAAALAGIAVAIYARWDDWKVGRR